MHKTGKKGQINKKIKLIQICRKRTREIDGTDRLLPVLERKERKKWGKSC